MLYSVKAQLSNLIHFTIDVDDPKELHSIDLDSLPHSVILKQHLQILTADLIEEQSDALISRTTDNS